MNFETFTDRAKGFIQAAQTIALRENHQQVTPEHLLKALLDDKDGVAATLLREAGADAPKAKDAVDSAVGKLPKVEGASQMYYAQPLSKALLLADEMAKKAGDSFVTAEYLLLALATHPGTEAQKILSAAKATPQALNQAIKALRKGRSADSASAEDQYDALKKYARDLTQAEIGRAHV